MMIGPADEAAVERVAEASRAATRIAGVHVLAARSQVALEVPPASILRDADGADRCAADRGACVDAQAEHVAEDEDGAALRGDALQGADQATAL